MSRAFAVGLGQDPDDHRTFEELLGRPAWMRHSACREHPELDCSRPPRVDVSEQRAVCESCLVREPCLPFALDQRDLDGVWAGTTRGQCRVLRAKGRGSAA